MRPEPPRRTADPAAPSDPPAYLRPVNILLVVGGGILGTLARYGLETSIPSPDGWPLATLLINLCGAFLLGVLLEALIRLGADAGRRRTIRLAVGTGFMGAFTTYSTLALEAAQLETGHRLPAAVLYVLLSLVGGVLASAAGIWAASIHHRRAVANGSRPASVGPAPDAAGRRPAGGATGQPADGSTAPPADGLTTPSADAPADASTAPVSGLSIDSSTGKREK